MTDNIDDLIKNEPRILENATLNMLALRYLVSDKQEYDRLVYRMSRFDVGLKIDPKNGDIRNLGMIAWFYEPQTRLYLLDEATHTNEEADEICNNIKWPVIRVNFFGEIDIIGHPKENIFPYRKTRMICPPDKNNAMILINPINQKKNHYMEIYFSEKPYLSL